MTEQTTETPAQAAPAAPAEATPVPPRRVLRAVARWTAAALVLGGLGAGTAFGINSMERTDVPGLATESDGRWDYPRLSLPALPATRPARTATATSPRSTTPTCGACCCPLRPERSWTRSSTAAG